MKVFALACLGRLVWLDRVSFMLTFVLRMITVLINESSGGSKYLQKGGWGPLEVGMALCTGFVWSAGAWRDSAD